MTTPDLHPEGAEPKERIVHPFRTLRELLDFVSGKSLPPAEPEEGLYTEVLPLPFLAIVGQREMKLALLLGLINPLVGGILLVGPRSTAKTTAVRSLLEILPRPFFPNIFWYNPVRLTGPTRGLPCRCGDLLKINRKE